jgi:hypothetical protein
MPRGQRGENGVSSKHVASQLENGLPALLRDIDDADDGTGSDPPARLASLALHPRCLLCAGTSVESSVPINLTHVNEPTNSARNALREFRDGDRVVRWGLVHGRDLGTPLVITGPLSYIASAHSTSGHEVCDVLRATGMRWRTETHIDTNEGCRVRADWSGCARAV